MSETLLEAMADRVLLGDGAMGTQLQQAGLEPGECGETWNLSHPDRVLEIQRRYVEAGSDCLITNTFGGSRIMLERHDMGDDTVAANRAGVRIAREAFGDRPGFVLGDLGPFGGMMEPFGDVSKSRVRDAYGEQATALVEAGADAIIIETQTSLDELTIGIEAARDANAPCVIGSMSYDVSADGSVARTMMGTTPEQAAKFMQEAGVDVVAVNCGTGVDVCWAAKIIEQYRATCDLPTMAQPNAGHPILEGSTVVYKQTPTEMAADIPALLAAGPRLLGTCCGSTPKHIRLIRELLDEHNGNGEQ